LAADEYHPRQPRLFDVLPAVRTGAAPDDQFADLFFDHALETVAGELQVGDQLGEAMLQRPRFAKLAQGDLAALLQGMADVTRELRTVDHHLREQGGGVDVLIACLDHQIGDRRPDRRRVQRPLHWQFNVRGSVGNAHHLIPRRRRVAHGERLGFDAVQDVQCRAGCP